MLYNGDAMTDVNDIDPVSLMAKYDLRIDIQRYGFRKIHQKGKSSSSSSPIGGAGCGDCIDPVESLLTLHATRLLK